MKIVGAENNHWLAIKNARLEPQPFWGYEDIGAFLLLAVLLGLVFRLLVHLQVLSRFAMDKPSIGLQSAVVTLLGAGLYFILRLRHRQPMLKPLGWVVPQIPHIVMALMTGPSLAASITLYLRLRDQITPLIPLGELLALGLILGPMLEESLFRGCLLPVLASTTGTIPAVVITAVLFALFHGPANLAHWLSFTATGVAYGWIRVASRSTTASALMHSAYNLTLYLLARW